MPLFDAFGPYRFNLILPKVHPSSKETTVMQGETGELWRVLCAQAAVEQDPEKLVELTTEINRLLDEKNQRVQAARQA